MNPIELRLSARAALALRRRLELASTDQGGAPALLRNLLERAPAARSEAVEAEASFASPALGDALLDRAEELFEIDPSEAAQLAALAAAIGRRLAPPWTHLEGEALQGKARSVEGEAFRRLGQIPEARKAQRLASRHLETLPTGCAERAAFCRHLARLRRDQGRDDEALALMARALERYKSLGYRKSRRQAQECRLDLAWMHLDDLETDEALVLFEAALIEEGVGGGDLKDEGRGTTPEDTALGRAQDRWLRLRHGLALAYADLRREEEARATLAEITTAVLDRTSVDPLRLKLLEASVLQRLDANDEAAELLFAAWSGYALAGKPHQAVLALLELTQLRAEQGSAQDLERLREGLSRLPGLRPNLREPLLFGLDFAQTHGLAGVELLEALKIFLERARHDPEARFALAQDLLKPEPRRGAR